MKKEKQFLDNVEKCHHSANHQIVTAIESCHYWQYNVNSHQQKPHLITLSTKQRKKLNPDD